MHDTKGKLDEIMNDAVDWTGPFRFPGPFLGTQQNKTDKRLAMIQAIFEYGTATGEKKNSNCEEARRRVP